MPEQGLNGFVSPALLPILPGPYPFSRRVHFAVMGDILYQMAVPRRGIETASRLYVYGTKWAVARLKQQSSARRTAASRSVLVVGQFRRKQITNARRNSSLN